MVSRKQELLAEVRWRRCRTDFAYFAENLWMIQTPRGAKHLDLRGPQREAFEVFERERYVVTLKARQIGWTTLCAAYSFWKAFFQDDYTIIFLSRGERESREILAKVDYGYKRLPEWLKTRGPERLSESQERMPFSNGSGIESLPSKKDPARGRTVNLVIVDEWAFFENPEEAWASIEPITDIGGRVIGLSTANGAGNFFHELWEKAESGHSPFVPLFYSWRAVPERDDAWYEDKRRNMPDWQLWQEYPENPEEAFIKSGNPVFDGTLIRDHERREPQRGFLLRVQSPLVEFRPAPEGELRVWTPPGPMGKYVIGADVAEGLEHGDFSSAHVIDILSQEVVAAWHGHIDPDLFGDVLHDLGWWYGRALIGVEANNHGHSTLAHLKRLHYPSIYYAWKYDERTRKQGRKIGWQTTRYTKPVMIDELAMAFRDGDLTIPDDSTLREMLTYQRDERGQMAGSPFDDRVISLAICNQMRKHAVAPRQEEAQPDTYGTLGWWSQMLDQSPPRRIGGGHVRGRVA